MFQFGIFAVKFGRVYERKGVVHLEEYTMGAAISVQLIFADTFDRNGQNRSIS